MSVAKESRHRELARPAEMPEERAKRLAHERELIEEARENIRAGLYIPDEEVDAWLDLLTGDEPLPIPERPRPKAR